jgi:5-oxopent-3-ene-1,2,5-tricarboxylate decarboxylase / 2-hydroxyhepta-2,4-diene-1,7-dioate isomerase
MTLAEGDVITLGVPHGSPLAHIGDEATLTIGPLPPLQLSFTGAAQQQGESR